MGAPKNPGKAEIVGWNWSPGVDFVFQKPVSTLQ